MHKPLTKIIYIWLSAFIVLFSFSPSYCLDVPKLRGHVNDYANILSNSSKQQIESYLSELERSDSTQIVILTIPSLEGENLEEYSMRVVDEWKIGQKNLDNGVMLLIAKNDRKLRIEVGYGLEGSLTDLISGQIIRNVITPQFRSGNFDKGVIDGIQAMVQAVRGQFIAENSRNIKHRRTSSGQSIFFLLIVFIYLINMAGRLRRPLGAVAGGIFFPLIGAILFNPGLLFLLILIPLGVIGGLFISLFGGPLSFGASHTRSSTRGGGLWYGGFSGGGGGFGGFSGGGGGFGGGGSSGGW